MPESNFGHNLSPQFLAKYQITGVLGEGGMGQVLRGRQTALGRDVAIKFLTLRSYATPERRQRFKDEAQRCAAMSHPNLVGVYDYGEEGERPYMVMELVDGESLADRLKREGTIPIREALEIGVAICDGLAYAHDLGLVHRDIKSDNILQNKAAREVKVADFGIAIESDDGSQKDNVIIGTPSYMSPEQASGKKADNRSDIYSTGVILYEMLTGKVPFTGETSMAIIIKHLNEQASSMTELNPKVPPQLEEIVLRALAKKPEERYQTVEELSSRLKKAISLLASWQAAKRDGRMTSGMHSSATGMIAISAAVPETQEEKIRRYAAYGAGALTVLAGFLGLIWVFFLAPPTYTATDFSEEAGATQAALGYVTNHPCRTRIEYRVQGAGETKSYRAEGERVTHQVPLDELKEDTAYRWRPVFPGGQFGPWREISTRRVDFTDIRMEARVNGAEVMWKTSIPVRMEVEYLQAGVVKEIVHLEGEGTAHSFKASFAEPSEPYALRLRAIFGKGFRASHMIPEVPVIDLEETKQLAKDIQATVSADSPGGGFPPDVVANLGSRRIRPRLEEFRQIREIFYEDPQVPAQTRMNMTHALSQLYEFDLALAWQDPGAARDFDTGARAAFGPGYLASRTPPFRGGERVAVLTASKVMRYDPDPPEDPISGELPEDATDNAKYRVDLDAIRDPPADAYFAVTVKDVDPNCYFRVFVGARNRHLLVVDFLPPREAVVSKKAYTGTLYARVDPRLIKPNKELAGWVYMRILRETLVSNEQLLALRAGFGGLKLVYKKGSSGG